MNGNSQQRNTLTRGQLEAATDAFFSDLVVTPAPSRILLSYFSTSEHVVFEHAPRQARRSPLYGLNAVRSYFDLLATHWTRYDGVRHRTDVYEGANRVVIFASVHWQWRTSGRSWREDFTCTLEFDDHLKIKTFVILTESSPQTCVMHAVDN
ncbi:hypothetical protein HGRIS_012960 [Hohenbuehelia grisea]|uniref:SnoaL-like domain-containing protein n=1 Tax=Hohenbuehelia grisea TaxID=104357 RepID=A0ABR3IU07_9AGAR